MFLFLSTYLYNELLIIFGILRCCSFLSIEKNKELNKSLSQANRKAKKMEQQLQKSKVNSFGCYFPSTEKKMIVTASLQKLHMGVVRTQLLFSLMIQLILNASDWIFFFQNRKRCKVSSLRQSLVSVNVVCTYRNQMLEYLRWLWTPSTKFLEKL